MENLDKAISFVQKGTSMYLLQLSRHASTKWLTVAPPYIADSCTCPSPGICPGQMFTIFPNWLKGLRDGFQHIIWQAIFMGNGTVQESGRNRNPLKKHKPPKMTT
jgi:hypothetical protein